jgi:hypothetical protein
MRLKVNGVEVRVVDRIEIELDVAQDGEDLIRGINIKVCGGELAIWPFAGGEASLVLTTEKQITFHPGTRAAISMTRESVGAWNPDQAVEYAVALKHNGGRGDALTTNTAPQFTPFHLYRVFYSLQEAQMNGETR